VGTLVDITGAHWASLLIPDQPSSLGAVPWRSAKGKWYEAETISTSRTRSDGNVLFVTMSELT